ADRHGEARSAPCRARNHRTDTASNASVFGRRLHDSPRNPHRLPMPFRPSCGSIPRANQPRGETTMWRKTISGGAAVLAVWGMGASPAAAQGWLFKLHGWPFAPKWGEATIVGEGESGVSKPNVSDGCPIETADGLSLLLASAREDPNDIWASDRASIGDPWPEPRKLDAPVNSPAGDFCPTPVMGRSLMFVSTRPGACPGELAVGGGDIYISRQ